MGEEYLECIQECMEEIEPDRYVICLAECAKTERVRVGSRIARKTFGYRYTAPPLPG